MYENVKVDVDDVVRALTGRYGGLRPSKPSKNGIYQYIWRMARFHSGADVTMPITCFWDLDRELKARGIHEVGCFIDTPEKKEFLNYLDGISDQVCERLGLSKYGGAKAWMNVI